MSPETPDQPVMPLRCRIRLKRILAIGRVGMVRNASPAHRICQLSVTQVDACRNMHGRTFPQVDRKRHSIAAQRGAKEPTDFLRAVGYQRFWGARTRKDRCVSPQERHQLISLEMRPRLELCTALVEETQVLVNSHKSLRRDMIVLRHVSSMYLSEAWVCLLTDNK